MEEVLNYTRGMQLAKWGNYKTSDPIYNDNIIKWYNDLIRNNDERIPTDEKKVISSSQYVSLNLDPDIKMIFCEDN